MINDGSWAEKMRGFWRDESVKRYEAEAQARELRAIISGLLIDKYEANMPLYRRIGNQRRALKDLASIQYVWDKVMTHEERGIYIDRWKQQRDAKAAVTP